jgi:hypothetical protein
MKDEEKKVLSPADLAKARDEFRPDSDLPPDADAEERFNDFWKRNGGIVFGLIALVAVVITAHQGYGLWTKTSEARLEGAFAGLGTTEAKLSFADEHRSHPLAGLAFLEVADAAYARGEFLQAGNHYDAAIAPLTKAGSPLSSRARLGAALARLRQGEANGLFLLEEIARDPEAIEVIRAQAAYHHAVASWERSDFDAVRRSLDLLDTFAGAPNWRREGSRLAGQIPELEGRTAAAGTGLNLGL